MVRAFALLSGALSPAAYPKSSGGISSDLSCYARTVLVFEIRPFSVLLQVCYATLQINRGLSLV